MNPSVLYRSLNRGSNSSKFHFSKKRMQQPYTQPGSSDEPDRKNRASIQNQLGDNLNHVHPRSPQQFWGQHRASAGESRSSGPDPPSSKGQPAQRTGDSARHIDFRRPPHRSGRPPWPPLKTKPLTQPCRSGGRCPFPQPRRPPRLCGPLPRRAEPPRRAAPPPPLRFEVARNDWGRVRRAAVPRERAAAEALYRGVAPDMAHRLLDRGAEVLRHVYADAPWDPAWTPAPGAPDDDAPGGTGGGGGEAGWAVGNAGGVEGGGAAVGGGCGGGSGAAAAEEDSEEAADRGVWVAQRGQKLLLQLLPAAAASWRAR